MSRNPNPGGFKEGGGEESVSLFPLGRGSATHGPPAALRAISH